MRLVDLDQLDAAGLDDLEAAWWALERRWAVRRVDPELREAILARLDRLEEPDAQEIREALEELAPAVVLAVYWRVLVPEVPALGAYRR